MKIIPTQIYDNLIFSLCIFVNCRYPFLTRRTHLESWKNLQEPRSRHDAITYSDTCEMKFICLVAALRLNLITQFALQFGEATDWEQFNLLWAFMRDDNDPTHRSSSLDVRNKKSWASSWNKLFLSAAKEEKKTETFVSRKNPEIVASVENVVHAF